MGRDTTSRDTTAPVSTPLGSGLPTPGAIAAGAAAIPTADGFMTVTGIMAMAAGTATTIGDFKAASTTVSTGTANTTMATGITDFYL